MKSLKVFELFSCRALLWPTMLESIDTLLPFPPQTLCSTLHSVLAAPIIFADNKMSRCIPLTLIAGLGNVSYNKPLIHARIL